MKNKINFWSFFCCLFFAWQGNAQEYSVSNFNTSVPANGAVSVAADGHIYISEYGDWKGNKGDGTRIFKFSPTGKVIDTISGLSGPIGTAVDSQGNLYVNNDNNTLRGEVLKISPEGRRTVFATIKGWPTGMNIDAQNNIYIPNYGIGIVHQISPDGTVKVLAEDPRLLGCTGIDFDSKGNVIVSNYSNARIFKITKEGKVSLIAEIPDITIQDFGIGYITVVDDVIYATAIAVGKIYKVTMEGEITLIAGSGERVTKNGINKEASFNGPNGIRGSKDGKSLYISEFGGSKVIRKVSIQN